MKIDIFLDHHLRTTEKREVEFHLTNGLSFKEAMQKVADNWVKSEGEEFMSTEREAFEFTNRELQEGIYD